MVIATKFERWPSGETPIDQRLGSKFEEIPTLTGLVPLGSIGVVSLEPPLPGTFLLGSLRDGRLQVTNPITISTSREGVHYVLEATDLNEFGFGTNPSEAIIDLQDAIAQLYLSLEEDQNRLGTDLAAVWSSLKSHIVKRS